MAQGKCKKLFVNLVQMKVVIIGKENIGKTALVKRIHKAWGFANSLRTKFLGKGKRESTDGVEMSVWQPEGMENVTVRMWDFAGQETYYTTHQFFLSSKAVHVVLFKMTERDERDIQYWWSSISARCREKPIIIMVGTFLDAFKSKQRSSAVKDTSQWLQNLFDKWKSYQTASLSIPELPNVSWNGMSICFYPGKYLSF